MVISYHKKIYLQSLAVQSHDHSYSGYRGRRITSVGPVLSWLQNEFKARLDNLVRPYPKNGKWKGLKIGKREDSVLEYFLRKCKVLG